MGRPGETRFPRTAGGAVTGAMYGRLSRAAEVYGVRRVLDCHLGDCHLGDCHLGDRQLGTELERRRRKAAETASASTADVVREGGA